MDPGFSMDEVEGELRQVAQAMLDELEKVKAERRRNDPGYTVAELAVVWGVTTSSAKKRLNKLKGAGKIIKGTTYRKTSDGRFYPVPSYRLRDEGENET